MKQKIPFFARKFSFWLLLLIAIALVSIQFVLNRVEAYQAELTNELSRLIEAPVTIGHVHARLYGLTPQLQLSELSVADEKLQFKEIRLSVNPWVYLTEHTLIAATSVTIVGAQLTLIRHVDDSITVEGLKAGDEQPLWLLQGKKYQLLKSTIHWQDEKMRIPSRKIASVNLAVLNENDQHRINLTALLPEQSKPLRVSMAFTGNVFDLTTLNGHAFVEADAVKLEEIKGVDLPLSIMITQGIAHLKAWATWQDGKLSDVSGELSSENMTLARALSNPINVTSLTIPFKATYQEDEWHISLPRLTARLSHAFFQSALDVHWNTRDREKNSIAWVGEKFDIASWLPLVQRLSDDESFLNKLQLGGTIANFRLFAQPEKDVFAVNAIFNELSLKDKASKLSIEHLDGAVKGTAQQGTLTISSSQLGLTANQIFRDTLPTLQLNTVLNWQKTPIAWQIDSDSIKLNSLDLTSETAFHLTLPDEGGGFLDLQSDFSCEDMAHIPRYLPAKVMGRESIAWLDHAFQKGRLKNGQLLFYGRLGDFPFAKGQGVFEMLFDADNVQLAYAPKDDWLPLISTTLQGRIYQESLQINLEGMAENTQIKTAEVTIPSLYTSDYVHVTGQVEGDIGHILHFLQQSRLRPRADVVLQAITPRGMTSLSLDMQISLVDGLDSKVNGVAHFKQADVTVLALDLPVKHINGFLTFTEKGMTGEDFEGIALNHPIHARLQNDNHHTEISVKGESTVDDLFQQLNISSLARFGNQAWIEGHLDYQITLTIPPGLSSSRLVFKSMLSGATLHHLPLELTKSKSQKTPLNLMFTLGHEEMLPLTLDYNSQLKAALLVDLKNKHLERGAILVGDGQVGLPNQNNLLSLKILKDEISLKEWWQLASLIGSAESPDSANMTSNQKNSASNVEIEVHTKHAMWDKSELGFLDLIFKNQKDTWQGVISSDLAQGLIIWQDSPVNKLNKSIKLVLEKLNVAYIQRFKLNDNELEDTARQINPTSTRSVMDFPSISLISQSTFWNEKPLGQLKIETFLTAKEQMLFKTIELQAPTHHLSLTGNWQQDDMTSLTDLQGKLTFINAGQMLANLGMTQDLSESHGDADLHFFWQGAPQDFSLQSLKGEMDLTLQNGRILSIEPGVGRILGVLALDQWLKRLQLDFSDVYSEGLTFNSIQGHFKVLQGKVNTQDLTVDAIPAKIALKGDIDLIHENINYLASVTPKSSDAVPIAGTIVGKIMGLVGQTLTGKDQEGFFFGSQYQLKGAWGNIDAIPLYDNDGLIQKTWHGITQFPWLPQQ